MQSAARDRGGSAAGRALELRLATAGLELAAQVTGVGFDADTGHLHAALKLGVGHGTNLKRSECS